MFKKDKTQSLEIGHTVVCDCGRIKLVPHEDTNFTFVDNIYHIKHCNYCDADYSKKAHNIGANVPWQSDANGHYKVCPDCKQKVRNEPHKMQWVITPTLHNQVCKDCGYSTIQGTHTFALKSRIEASCTSDGKIIEECKCGKQKETILPSGGGHNLVWDSDNSRHWQKCSKCSYQTNVGSHRFEEDFRVDATCSNNGYVNYVCLCGKTRQDILPATGLHRLPANWSKVEGDFGYHYKTCSVCGNTISERHTWADSGSVPASCTSPGYVDRYCTVCGIYGRVENQSALGHDIKTDHNDSKHWQYCSRCSYKTTKVSHEYSSKVEKVNNDYTNHYKECKVCHYQKAEAHKWKPYNNVAATCTTEGHLDRKCSTCGLIQYNSSTTPALGHNYPSTYSTNATKHWKVCTRCDSTYGMANHTAPVNGKCNICGKTLSTSTPSTPNRPGPANGTNYVN